MNDAFIVAKASCCWKLWIHCLSVPCLRRGFVTGCASAASFPHKALGRSLLLALRLGPPVSGRVGLQKHNFRLRCSIPASGCVCRKLVSARWTKA